jgi:RNA polymerase sigma-70 factor (ECF subfamily)
MNENKLSEFQELFDANASQLIRFARRFTSEEKAEDIVQDVFLELWQRFDSSEVKDYRAYLFTAVRNRCLNSLKHEHIKENHIKNIQTENRLLGLDYFDSAEKFIIDKEHLQVIYRQINLLPEKCREIFKLSYFENKKSAEIAQLLQLSIRTVEHHLYLGLKTLREKLKNSE